MGCGCAGKKRSYLVTTKAGTQKSVSSLSAAINVVRTEGGSYQVVKT